MKLQNNLYTISSPPSGLAGDGTLICMVHLIEDCMIYKAHFPNAPTTPGACIIQIAQELYEQVCGQTIEITQVENAKFLKVMTPDSDNCYRYSFSKATTSHPSKGEKLQVVVSCDDTIYAKFTLICKTI